MVATEAVRRNNFDALRLLAAVSVIFSHSFLIAFLLALPTTAVLAFASWHLIERPALRLRPGGTRAAALNRAGEPQRA